MPKLQKFKSDSARYEKKNATPATRKISLTTYHIIHRQRKLLLNKCYISVSCLTFLYPIKGTVPMTLHLLLRLCSHKWRKNARCSGFDIFENLTFNYLTDINLLTKV